LVSFKSRSLLLQKEGSSKGCRNAGGIHFENGKRGNLAWAGGEPPLEKKGNRNVGVGEWGYWENP